MKTVSEWIEAGHFSSGKHLLEKKIKETDKAIGFSVEKINRSGNIDRSVCWIPKRFILTVSNDYYSNGPEIMYLVDSWIIRQKKCEGFIF